MFALRVSSLLGVFFNGHLDWRGVYGKWIEFIHRLRWYLCCKGCTSRTWLVGADLLTSGAVGGWYSTMNDSRYNPAGAPRLTARLFSKATAAYAVANATDVDLSRY